MEKLKASWTVFKLFVNRSFSEPFFTVHLVIFHCVANFPQQLIWLMIEHSDKPLNLTFCNYCHEEVAKNALTCPHCGRAKPAMSEKERSDHLRGGAWRTVLFSVVITGMVIWAIKNL